MLSVSKPAAKLLIICGNFLFVIVIQDLQLLSLHCNIYGVYLTCRIHQNYLLKEARCWCKHNLCKICMQWQAFNEHSDFSLVGFWLIWWFAFHVFGLI